MSAYIILSAGAGRNMRTKGAKALLRYDGVAVLDHQIRAITSFDKNADISVVVGFEGDKIIKHISNMQYDVRILYNYNFKLTSQSESWRLALNSTRTIDYYLIHGDIIFNKSILKMRNKSTVILDKAISNKKSIGVLHQNGVVFNMGYGFPEKWSQIVYISKQDYALSKTILNSFKTNKMTFEVLNMISQKIPLAITYALHKTAEINRDYENIDSE
jgi:choline kinase